MESGYKYLAFISYKREDEKWAAWLQRKFEDYRLPSRIRKAYNLPSRLPHLYRDTTDIEPGTLSDTLRKSLNSSKFLIVICSPRSASSYWVGEEIRHFIQQGRQEQILLFIIEGKPYSGDAETECLHPVIKEHLPEMLGVNVHEEGFGSRYLKKEKAFIRLLSKTLGISFDTLWDRYRRREIRRRITIISVFLTFIAALSLTWQLNQAFNLEIRLSEKIPVNNRLPFPQNGGILILHLDNQRLYDTLFSIEQPGQFMNIPAKYRNQQVRIQFSAPGYSSVDTLIKAGREMKLWVRRDPAYYGIVKGIVRDQIDDLLIPGSEVDIAGIRANCGANGGFTITIPLEMQDTVYLAHIKNSNYKNGEYTVVPQQNNTLIINTLYLKK